MNEAISHLYIRYGVVRYGDQSLRVCFVHVTCAQVDIVKKGYKVGL